MNMPRFEDVGATLFGPENRRKLMMARSTATCRCWRRFPALPSPVGRGCNRRPCDTLWPNRVTLCLMSRPTRNTMIASFKKPSG